MIPNTQLEAIEIDLHPEAEKRAKQYVMDFATSLLLQAKLIAFRTKADMVLSNYIDEALDSINRDKNRTWSRELLIILGSAFVGAFIQGFVSELATGNALLIATYTVLGFVGMFMVFLGLRR